MRSNDPEYGMKYDDNMWAYNSNISVCIRNLIPKILKLFNLRLALELIPLKCVAIRKSW